MKIKNIFITLPLNNYFNQFQFIKYVCIYY